MQFLSIVLAVLGVAVASWGAVHYVVKPGAISSFCLSLIDAGKSKIAPVTYSCFRIAAGFLIMLLSYFTDLYSAYSFPGYWLLFTIIVMFSVLLLFYFPKKVVEREKRLLEENCQSK